jgi:hypothetical protein
LKFAIFQTWHLIPRCMHCNFYILLSASSFKEETTTALVHCLSASDHRLGAFSGNGLNPLPLHPRSPPTPCLVAKHAVVKCQQGAGIFRIRHVSRNCLGLPRSDALLVCGLLHCFMTLTPSPPFPPSPFLCYPKPVLLMVRTKQKRKVRGGVKKLYISSSEPVFIRIRTFTKDISHISTTKSSKFHARFAMTIDNFFCVGMLIAYPLNFCFHLLNANQPIFKVSSLLIPFLKKNSKIYQNLKKGIFQCHGSAVLMELVHFD